MRFVLKYTMSWSNTFMNKIYSYLGLSMRAGKLITGDEGVLKAVRAGEAKLVIVASDASENTIKKFKDKCFSYRVPCVQFGLREKLNNSIGKSNRIVIAIIDDGFAKMIQNEWENNTEV